MPRIMWKNFHHCFPSNLTNTKPSSSSSSPSAAATATDDPNRPSIILINNFNILYDHSKPLNMDLVPSSSTTTTTTTTFTTSSSSSNRSENYVFAPEDDTPPPDLTAVYASRRFFFSSPGRTNSITDSRDDNIYETATTSSSSSSSTLLSGGTAVKQYVQSPDPYNDFRRSMQEMLDAVDFLNPGDSRRYEFLHELLLSYLKLNSQDTHKFIISAFADILVTLLSDGHRTC